MSDPLFPRPLSSFLYNGSMIFELKATHGLPLDFVFDEVINKQKLSIDWVGFIEAARRNKWWDFQIYDLIEYSLRDSDVNKELTEGILFRFKIYVMKHPHSGLKRNE